MTSKQSYQIYEAVKCLQSARKWLELTMFNSFEELPENESKRVRKAYDLICDANDQL